MTPDERIDRLIAALSQYGVHPSAPADDAALEQLESELAPLTLPETLRRLWQRVDVRTLRFSTFPTLSNPAFALSGWRLDRDSAMSPPGLLAFCYESHFWRRVELEGAGATGGAVFDSGAGDDTVRLRCAGIDDWLDTTIALLDEEAFEWYEHGDGPWMIGDGDRADQLHAERLAARRPHPLYGDLVEIPAFDEDAWPGHWQRAAGIVRAAQAPVGATTTVSELLSAARSKDVSGTLAGCVMEHYYLAGTGPRLMVTDRTGVLDIAVPLDVAGARIPNPVWVEIDVDVARLDPPQPMVDWQARHRADSDFGQYPPQFPHLLGQIRPQAVARAVRALEDDPAVAPQP